MTHKEYTLVVKYPILEKVGDSKSVFKRPGEVYTISKDEFDELKSGKTISTLKIDKDNISRPFVSNQNLYLVKDNAIIRLN